MRQLPLLLLVLPLFAATAALTPAWVELGPGHRAIARIVIAELDGSCPSITIDDSASVPMKLRLPVPKGFRAACEFEIPTGTRRAAVGNQTLTLPVDNPARLAVLGDTGCRLKGDRIQACNDPAMWPFATVAATAARERPQLVIHVGDYLYRETPCPAAETSQCGGSPNGDNWEAWNADFFGPAAKLLAAAPWVFTRGNHESCGRSWRGWFYYLDPRPFPEACPEYSEPYLVSLGAFQLLMMDSSAAKDAMPDPIQVAKYAAMLKPYATTKAWLVEHHPIWGLKHDATDEGDVPSTAVMKEAYESAGLANIGLVLAGHTHLFEILSYSGGRSPQIVAGDAGTSLASTIRKDLKGETVFGIQVESGTSRHEFGFTILEHKKQRWNLVLKDPADKTLASCRIQGKAVRCKGAR